MKKSLSYALIFTSLICTLFTFILFSYRNSTRNVKPYSFYEKDTGKSLISDEYWRKTLLDYLKKYASTSLVQQYRINKVGSSDSRKGESARIGTQSTILTTKNHISLHVYKILSGSVSKASQVVQPVGYERAGIQALVEFIDQSRSTLGDLLNYITSTTSKLRVFVADKAHLINGLERLERYSSNFVNALLVGSNIFEQESNILRERRTKIRLLSEKIQKRIYEYQNKEANCEERRIFLCNLTNFNGFASGIHDVLWCFAEAYHSGKRVLLLSSNWHYSHEKNWTELAFQPLSIKCPENLDSYKPDLIPQHSNDNDNRHRGIINRIPRDIVEEFAWLGHDPLAWWYGQFIGYVLRPNEKMTKAIKDAKLAIGFSRPIVGLHIRRTDKVGNEAKFHSANEYMIEARRFYDKLDLMNDALRQPDIIGQKNFNRISPIERKVFVATDDPGVYNELKEHFGEYKFVYQKDSANLARNPNTRYSNDSLFNLIIDLYLLASSDYLVCTMSSGFCRLAFELSNYLKSEKSTEEENSLKEPAFATATSLDIAHHYAWINAPTRVAVYGHNSESPKQMSAIPGDVLEKENEFTPLYEALAGKTLDGFNRWRNKRTRKVGLIPDYKTRILVPTA